MIIYGRRSFSSIHIGEGWKRWLGLSELVEWLRLAA